MINEKRGLWDNINAKRKRIKAGSGERMRKPGSKGAPTAADFKAASEEVSTLSIIKRVVNESLYECNGNCTCGKKPPVSEAEYQGRQVPLGKPMKGDVKKSKVYVKDPSTGNVKKVEFGDPNMKIKKNIPARRKSFRARHRCDNPGPRTKARYWSCRAW